MKRSSFGPVVAKLIFGGLVVTLASPPAVQAYGPSCPWCTKEPNTVPSPGAVLQVSMKWCGLEEAPSVDMPALACQSNFKTMLWRRHERATDCILTPEANITLRSGGAVQQSDYLSFPDLDVSVGAPGDLSVEPPFTELVDTWMRCDMEWAAQPKGVITVNANRLVNAAGMSVARGIALEGSATFPWLAVADLDVFCQLNERSLAHEVGHVLGLPHPVPAPPNNLMESGGFGATLEAGQISSIRTYLAATPLLDPPATAVDLNKVDYAFDEFRELPRELGYLDVRKVVVQDLVGTGGRVLLHTGTAGPLSGQTSFPVRYWMALDTDNDAGTGGDPSSMLPGFSLEGTEVLVEVRVESLSIGGFIALPTLYRFDPQEQRFIEVNLAEPSDLRAEARNLKIVIDRLPGDPGPDTFDIATEVSVAINPSLLSSPQGTLAATGVGGLFPRGLRLQASATDEANPEPMDEGFDPPAELDFPEVVFPVIEAPETAIPGDSIELRVTGMPPERSLVVFLGELQIDPGVESDASGAAEMVVPVPEDVRLGNTLLSVGVDDPVNAITADTSIDVVETSTTCLPSATRMCLNNERFLVEARWATADGNSGFGQKVRLDSDFGYFWFFSPTNAELFVKVLDACVEPFNRYWVFAAGLTNVEVELTVTDTLANETRIFTNPLGTPFAPIQNTQTFDTCP